MTDTTSPPKVATKCIQGRRPYNEDGILSVSLLGDRALLAVADGMGGHAAGEVASAIALEVLQEALEGGHTLAESFHLANERVHDKARSDVGKQGMGTTLVAMLVSEGTFEVANVGDSRGYVITAEGIRQVTEDHSFVAEAVKRGQPEEEARMSKWKDALTRSIGTAEQVEVDTFGPFPIEGDMALLICSDGLYKTLTDADLEELFSTAEGVGAAAEALVSGAYDRGSDDNISVVLGEFGELPRREPGRAPAADADAAATRVLDTPMEDSEADAVGDVTRAAPVETGAVSPPPSSGMAPMVLAFVAVVIVVALVVYLI